MARPRKFIDGVPATKRLAFNVTPQIEAELEMIASLLGIEVGDIIRELLNEYTSTTLERIHSGEITNETIERVLKKQGT
jgi:hypothetical protein